ncbi:MAG: hypothetical protein ACRDYV_10525 [Acidimicrobiia bacterium]
MSTLAGTTGARAASRRRGGAGLTVGTPVVSTKQGGTSSANFSATLPAYVPGDVWLMFVDIPGNLGQSTPSGWTLVGSEESSSSSSGTELTVFRRTPDGSEGSTVTVAWTGATMRTCCVAIFPISGADTASPMSGSLVGASSSSGSTSLPHAGMTTAHNNAVVFDAMGQRFSSDATYTHAGGFTGKQEVYAPDSLADDMNLSVAYKVQAAAGATGAINGSSTAAAPWAHVACAVRPA